MTIHFDFDLKSRGREKLPRRIGRTLYVGYVKRGLDVLLALLLLPALLPVIVLLWLLVRRDGGPGFFVHERVGKGGKVFGCYKLRTMRPDAETCLKDVLCQQHELAKEWKLGCKLSADPRVTGLGQRLRRIGLDELPQIWNVVRGDMSFVGPRPVPHDELRRYGMKRHVYEKVRPGITGLWQVSGRNQTSYDRRIELDEAYVKDLSLKTDVTVLWRTLKLIFNPNGI